MAWTSISDILDGESISTTKLNDLQGNIDDLRDRLEEASAYSWSEMPISAGGSIQEEDINELKNALDDSKNKNNCQDCSDKSDRADDANLTNQSVASDDNDNSGYDSACSYSY